MLTKEEVWGVPPALELGVSERPFRDGGTRVEIGCVVCVKDLEEVFG